MNFEGFSYEELCILETALCNDFRMRNRQYAVADRQYRRQCDGIKPEESDYNVEECGKLLAAVKTSLARENYIRKVLG